jgi:periplasmic divalent cation tolerance protein
MTEPPALVQLVTTFGDKEGALEVARAAIQDRVAACVQVIGPITSVYRWEGSVDEEEEFLCLMKVPSGALAALVRFVRDRHPYGTPELTALPCSFVEDDYLAWARKSVT